MFGLWRIIKFFADLETKLFYTVSIKGLNKADVLAALYNGACFKAFCDDEVAYTSESITRVEAEKLLEEHTKYKVPLPLSIPPNELFQLLQLHSDDERIACAAKFGIKLKRIKTISFHDIHGRSIRVSLAKDEEFNSENYEYNNCSGDAKKVIKELRSTGDVNSPFIQEMHRRSTLRFAKKLRADFPYLGMRLGIPDEEYNVIKERINRFIASYC